MRGQMSAVRALSAIFAESFRAEELPNSIPSNILNSSEFLVEFVDLSLRYQFVIPDLIFFNLIWNVETSSIAFQEISIR